jgi:pyruvate formate lyase activating enzyme
MVENRPGGFALTKREWLKAGFGAFCAFCVVGSGRSSDVYAQTARKGFVQARPGKWFSGTNNNKVRCELCPWKCELEPNQTARCRVRSNYEGIGYTLAYGNPVLVQEDPVERKPFFHVLPGSRSLSISTAGCNLACRFCEVWDMALVAPEEVHAYDMPPKNVVDHAGAARLKSVSYAFGEPVVFYEYMFETAELARERGLLNLLHTAAYIQPEPLKALSDKIDAANVDLKSFDPKFYRDICDAELEPVLKSLEILRKAGVHVEITNVVIPTLNDDMRTIRRMCTWIKNELGADVPIHFARFYPLFKLANLPQTPVSTLDNARNTALDVGLEYVYVSRVAGHSGENTFCPACGEMIIKRIGFVIAEAHLAGGSCAYCGVAIPGRWV